MNQEQNVLQQINENPVAKTTMKAFLFLGGSIIAGILNAKVGLNFLNHELMGTSSALLMATLGTTSLISTVKSVDNFLKLSDILAQEKFEKNAVRINEEDNYRPRNKM